jgi:excisionase family DNA binding protein
MNGLLTPAEVAKLLNVHITTIRRWLKRGVLAGTQVGGRLWFIKREDVDALLSKQGKAVEISDGSKN